MKKIFQFAAMAILAIGVSSCVKDVTETSGPDVQDQQGKLTFVLPLAQTGVTYARDLSASDAEKEIVLANTKIFMFDTTTSELEEIIDGASATEGATGGKKTVTIDIDEEWIGGKKFYFVGNTGTATSLPTAVSSTVTESNFLDLVTASQGNTHLVTPLLLTGIAPVSDIQNASSVNVSLYRSVARFDIDNNVAANNVTIEQVYVEKANLQGYVMGYHRSGAGAATIEFASGVATGDLSAVAVKAADSDDDTDNDNQLHESAFYLYPTMLKADASATNIRLVAKIGDGASEIFIVKKYNNATNQPEDFAIEANRRYKISAVADPIVGEGEVMFVLTAEDWDEGEEIIGTPDVNGSGFGIVAPVAADITNGIFNPTYNSIAVGNPTDAFSATLKVKGTSTKGIATEVIAQSASDHIEVGADIISATAVYDNAGVTYAAPYFGYDLTIAFDASKIEADKNFTTIVRLTDVASGATDDILIHYGSVVTEDGKTFIAMYPTGAGFLPAVKLGEIWWAPVNVGATRLNGTTDFSDVGYYFQFGRPTGLFFNPRDIANGDFIPSEYVVQGPVSEADAHSGKYIIGVDNHWLESGKEGALWQNKIGPCPTGWRLPSNDEIFMGLVKQTKGTAVLNLDMNRLELSLDNGTLCIPVSGNLYGQGKVWGINEMGYFWSSSMISANKHSVALQMKISDISDFTTHIIDWVSAVPVRCVKDAE